MAGIGSEFISCEEGRRGPVSGAASFDRRRMVDGTLSTTTRGTCSSWRREVDVGLKLETRHPPLPVSEEISDLVGYRTRPILFLSC